MPFEDRWGGYRQNWITQGGIFAVLWSVCKWIPSTNGSEQRRRNDAMDFVESVTSVKIGWSCRSRVPKQNKTTSKLFHILKVQNTLFALVPSSTCTGWISVFHYTCLQFYRSIIMTSYEQKKKMKQKRTEIYSSSFQMTQLWSNPNEHRVTFTQYHEAPVQISVTTASSRWTPAPYMVIVTGC